jgi:hypothetical protein
MPVRFDASLAPSRSAIPNASALRWASIGCVRPTAPSSRLIAGAAGTALGAELDPCLVYRRRAAERVEARAAHDPRPQHCGRCCMVTHGHLTPSLHRRRSPVQAASSAASPRGWQDWGKWIAQAPMLPATPAALFRSNGRRCLSPGRRCLSPFCRLVRDRQRVVADLDGRLGFGRQVFGVVLGGVLANVQTGVQER